MVAVELDLLKRRIDEGILPFGGRRVGEYFAVSPLFRGSFAYDARIVLSHY